MPKLTAVFALASAALLCGCPSSQKCDSSTCPSGCCDPSGQCQAGNTAAACGAHGALCQSCLGGCSAGLCVAAGGGAGGGTGGGGGGGGGSGGGTGGGGSDGGASQLVTRTVVFHTEAGPVSEPVDFSAAGAVTPELWVKNGNVWMQASGAALGTQGYRFDNVPAGERYLKYGRTWVVQPQNPLQLDVDVAGRPGHATTDGGTLPVHLSCSGLSAWQDGTQLQLMAPNAGLFNFGFELGMASLPDAGVVPTQLDSDEVLAYQSVYGAVPVPLADTTQGDQVFLTVLEPGAFTADAGQLTYWRALKSATLSPYVEVPGQALAATASFAPGTGGLVTFDWRRSEWWARAPEVHPNVRTDLSLDTIDVAAVEYGADAGLYDSAPDLVYGSDYVYGPDDFFGSIVYTNPYPASWPLVGEVNSCFYSQPFSLGADAGTLAMKGCIGHLDLLNRFGAGALHPKLSPPANFMVNGFDGHANLTLANLTPQVSWDAVPGAGSYWVSVVKPAADGSGGYSRSTAAQLVTTQTSVTLPPNTLASGDRFFILVQAEASPVTVTSTPFLQAFPDAWAATFSGLLKAP